MRYIVQDGDYKMIWFELTVHYVSFETFVSIHPSIRSASLGDPFGVVDRELEGDLLREGEPE